MSRRQVDYYGPVVQQKIPKTPGKPQPSSISPPVTPTPSSEPCPGAYLICPPPWPGATPEELENFYSTCCD